MARSSKTVSIRHLHAEVKTALEAAKKKHPAVRIESFDDSGGVVTLPIYFRYPWIWDCRIFRGLILNTET